MEAPEKIYLEKVYPDNGVLPNGLNYNQSPNDIEYIRADAFLKKACKFLQEEVLDDYSGIVWEGIIEDFINYIKGD